MKHGDFRWQPVKSVHVDQQLPGTQPEHTGIARPSPESWGHRRDSPVEIAIEFRGKGIGRIGNMDGNL